MKHVLVARRSPTTRRWCCRSSVVFAALPGDPKTVVLTVTCLDAPVVLLSFEPEGAQHSLQRGDWFRVEIVGPDDGDAEVSYSPGGLTIGAWPGSATRVWNKAGEELAT
jgi:hypothetical protein